MTFGKESNMKNFVFGFRNVLAVEAHRRLTSVFNREQWSLKRKIRAKIENEERSVEYEIISPHGNRDLGQLIENSRLNLEKCLVTEIEEMLTRIQHYFKCPGCSDCDSTVKNRHLLANNEMEFGDDVNWLHKTLIKEIDSAMDELKARMDIVIFSQDMEKDMNDKLKKKVRDILSLQKSKEITHEEVEEEFRKFWDELTRDAARSSKRMLTGKENIKGMVPENDQRSPRIRGHTLQAKTNRQKQGTVRVPRKTETLEVKTRKDKVRLAGNFDRNSKN